MKLLPMVAVLGASGLPILAGLGIVGSTVATSAAWPRERTWTTSPRTSRSASSAVDEPRLVAAATDRVPDHGDPSLGGNVTLDVLDSWSTHNVTGTYGDDIRADPGREYRHVTIEVDNHGRLDIGVHAYNSTAFDDSHRRSKAVLGIEDSFEVMQVGRGDAVDGTIFWQGELYNATLDLS